MMFNHTGERNITHSIHQKLGAEETHTSKNLNNFGDETNVKHRLRQLNVAKMTGTLCHVTWSMRTWFRS